MLRATKFGLTCPTLAWPVGGGAPRWEITQQSPVVQQPAQWAIIFCGAVPGAQASAVTTGAPSKAQASKKLRASFETTRYE